MVWQYLLTAWLKNAAKEKVYEHVREAAQRQAAGADQPGQAEEPAPERPCDVGIVFSSVAELGGMEDRLAGCLTMHGGGFQLRAGGLQGRHVVLVESGGGAQRAAQATEALLDGHQPQWVIAAGFAAGLQTQLRRGDILLADMLLNEQGGQLTIDLKVSSPSTGQPSERSSSESRQAWHTGALLSTEKFVHSRATKLALAAKFNALAADAESMAVAEVCRRRKARFMAVRIISETLDDELSPALRRLARQKTKPGRLGAAVGAMLDRPSGVKDLWRVKEDALVSSDRLAKCLESVVVRLAPLSPQPGVE